MPQINYYDKNRSQKRPNESSLGKMNYSYDYDGGTCWGLRSAKVFLSVCSSSHIEIKTLTAPAIWRYMKNSNLI